ncbi:MAG: hypothetical protein ACRDZY_21220 [Acidimicrobiales bacterium]
MTRGGQLRRRRLMIAGGILGVSVGAAAIDPPIPAAHQAPAAVASAPVGAVATANPTPPPAPRRHRRVWPSAEFVDPFGATYSVTPLRVVDPDTEIDPTGFAPTPGTHWLSIEFRVAGLTGGIFGYAHDDWTGNVSVFGADRFIGGEALITSAAGPSLMLKDYRSLKPGQSVAGLVNFWLPDGDALRGFRYRAIGAAAGMGLNTITASWNYP